MNMNDAPGWEQVDFGSRVLARVDGDGRPVDVPATVTNIELQEIARTHFPEGPAAAIESQKAWLQHQAGAAAEKAALPIEKSFFFRSKQPMPEAAKRWDGFVANCNRHWLKSRTEHRRLASVDWRAGVALAPRQEARQTSWRDRRPVNARANDKGRER